MKKIIFIISLLILISCSDPVLKNYNQLILGKWELQTIKFDNPTGEIYYQYNKGKKGYYSFDDKKFTQYENDYFEYEDNGKLIFEFDVYGICKVTAEDKLEIKSMSYGIYNKRIHTRVLINNIFNKALPVDNFVFTKEYQIRTLNKNELIICRGWYSKGETIEETTFFYKRINS